jgi:hypothetical protein
MIALAGELEFSKKEEGSNFEKIAFGKIAFKKIKRSVRRGGHLTPAPHTEATGEEVGGQQKTVEQAYVGNGEKIGRVATWPS